jgi:hypothetical protein
MKENASNEKARRESTCATQPTKSRGSLKVDPSMARPEQGSEVIELAIADIVIEPSVNVRHGALDLDTIDVYTNARGLPPIDTMFIGGKHHLGNGEHRFQAAINRGDKTIRAVVVRGSTLDELRDHSDLSNLQHGLPLTRIQRREVARRLHTRHPDWSNRELAKRMGTSHPTISAYLKDDSKTNGKNLPPTKPNSADFSPVMEPALRTEPKLPAETGAAEAGLSSTGKPPCIEKVSSASGANKIGETPTTEEICIDFKCKMEVAAVQLEAIQPLVAIAASAADLANLVAGVECVLSTAVHMFEPLSERAAAVAPALAARLATQYEKASTKMAKMAVRMREQLTNTTKTAESLESTVNPVEQQPAKPGER